jgi:hypothetical protein
MMSSSLGSIVYKKIDRISSTERLSKDELRNPTLFLNPRGSASSKNVCSFLNSSSKTHSHFFSNTVSCLVVVVVAATLEASLYTMGTLAYIAPEVLSHWEYDGKVSQSTYF